MNDSVSKLRVLIIHNRYLKRGGEDVSVDRELRLLRNAGHEAELLLFDNKSLEEIPLWRRIWALFYNHRAITSVRRSITSYAPDVVHVHNFAYYASPSILMAVKSMGVPLVMTLHNYRLICVNGLLMRGGRICVRCVRQSWPIWGAYYGCFQQSRLKSLVLQLIFSYHRWRGTFRLVDRFLVLSEFARNRLAESALGVPLERFFVTTSSTLEAVYSAPQARNRRLLYVGRLSQEKGISFLLQLFTQCAYELDIIGAGPYSSDVEVAAAQYSDRVLYHGQQTQQEVKHYMSSCYALLLPSLWYEGLPHVLIEAYALGTPVIASDNESLRQFVTHEESGLCCSPEDLSSWSTALHRIQSDDTLYAHLCRGARKQYETRFTEELNVRRLTQAYEAVISETPNEHLRKVPKYR